MKTKTTIVAAALALVPSFALAAGGPSSDNAETQFMVYYGTDFSEPIMAALSESDVLVVHPGVDGLTPAVVAELQDRGVSEVLCYLSLGEDAGRNPVHVGDGSGPTTHDGASIVAENAGVASFYVDSTYDGAGYVQDLVADTNGDHGSRYVFPNAAWRDVLEHQRINGSDEYPLRNDAGLAQILGERASDDDTDRTANLGCDGIFMDTLGTAAPFLSTGDYAWAAEEMSHAIEEIRGNYPDAYLMANGAGYFFNPAAYNATFDVRPYDYTIRPFIDAIAWESYRILRETGEVSPFFGGHANSYAPKIAAESMRDDGFAVFTIEYAENATEQVVADTVTAVSEENGWTSYFAEDETLLQIGRHIGDLGLSVDTSPPTWDHSGSSSAPDRVGIQRLELGEGFGELIVGWDVAKDQTGPITFDVEVSQAADMSSAILFEDVRTRVGEGWAQDPYGSVAYEATVGGLSDGEYYVRVRARDGLGQSEQNDVILSILVENEGVSNSAAGILADGDLEDWFDLEPLGADPDDLPGYFDNSDATMIWMGDHDDTLYIAIDVEGTYDWGWRNLLLFDTDRDTSTGYHSTVSLGADYLIKGNRVYRYHGTGEDWSWRAVGRAAIGEGEDGEMALPLEWIGNPTAFDVIYKSVTYPREYAPDSAGAPGGNSYLYVVSGQ